MADHGPVTTLDPVESQPEGAEPKPVSAAPQRGVGNPWIWKLLTLPGIVWLSLFFLAPMYVVAAILFGGVDPILRQPVPVWNPLDWDFSQFNYVMGRSFGPDALLPAGTDPHGRVRRGRQLPVSRDRLPGRLLHRTLLGSVEGPAAGGADRAVLDQLHDADAGVDQPAADRRPAQQDPQLRRALQRALRLAAGAQRHCRPGSGLRLRALHDPAVVRRARPRAGVRPRSST